ncbi:MAG: hypothetical protein VKL60_20220, partial [Sphaerospermopsis sp.]|nr:hypothetical protein [Sphaerospermopsis sp.]
RAKHSENSLFIKLIICRPNASPLRLLTPDSYALTERLSQQPLLTKILLISIYRLCMMNG